MDRYFTFILKKEDIAERVIIVGDQGRVDLVASYFDSTRFVGQNREFRTVTGEYRGKEVTVISSGIGTDNIDILLNELDATVNFNLDTKIKNKTRKALTIVRLGTSGALQGDLAPGSFIASARALGFDSVMNYYSGVEKITDPEFEKAFMKFVKWSPRLGTPYIVNSDPTLLSRFEKKGVRSGITVSAPGFYGPQGRTLSIEPADPALNDKLEAFRYKGMTIDNYEMESSAIYGLSAMLGHRALTICAIIGNRITGEFLQDYNPAIRKLTELVLEEI
ncbi:MAG: nucleoside phosphorylase [Bacteroidales bacterium]